MRFITHAFFNSGLADPVVANPNPLAMNKHGVPWNKDKAVGQKRPFTFSQIEKIARLLEEQKAFRDLCLFCLGVDTMLRGSDLVLLKVSDVMRRNQHPRSELMCSQQKTGQPVAAALSPYTQSAVACHVSAQNLASDAYLFSAMSGEGHAPLTTNYLRRLVKKWASLIGLDCTDYSSHSLRRSKPAHLYAHGVRPEMLRYLLGHSSLKSTQEYLGLDRDQALDLARQYDCFGRY